MDSENSTTIDEDHRADSDDDSADTEDAVVDAGIPIDRSPADAAQGKRVALLGRFGGMNQREAAAVLRSYNAKIVESDAAEIDWLVIGAEESPLAEAELVGKRLFHQAAAGELEILHESELWQRLGLVDHDASNRRYYTPVMLANLLDVSVRVIRRWHRRGLITPVHTLHRLPYFDFQEVTTAKRLAQWIRSGASPKTIEQRLVELVEVLPDIQRPLDQLNILVEGKQVLLRNGEGLLEPGGQMRFDFDDVDETQNHEGPGQSDVLRVFDDSQHQALSEAPAVLSMFEERKPQQLNPLLAQAYAAEDEGNLQTAIDTLHVLMGREGPRADWCFQLGELLYRVGDTGAARERYFMAIELDAEFVEARCSLGVALYEEGRLELSIAAFRGALSLHEEYPDVHYYLARALDETGSVSESKHHWIRFLDLAPDSPWAGEARDRIDRKPTDV